MEILVWIGTALTLAGFAGLLWSIVGVVRARRRSTSEEELRTSLQRALPLNLAALLLSFLGLTMVIVGVILT